MRHMFSVDDPISYVTSIIQEQLTHHTDTLTDSKDMLRGSKPCDDVYGDKGQEWCPMDSETP